VKDQLVLPEYNEITMPLSFTPIELRHYLNYARIRAIVKKNYDFPLGQAGAAERELQIRLCCFWSKDLYHLINGEPKYCNLDMLKTTCLEELRVLPSISSNISVYFRYIIVIMFSPRKRSGKRLKAKLSTLWTKSIRV
jgi:hypothetical protein